MMMQLYFLNNVKLFDRLDQNEDLSCQLIFFFHLKKQTVLDLPSSVKIHHFGDMKQETEKSQFLKKGGPNAHYLNI